MNQLILNKLDYNHLCSCYEMGNRSAFQKEVLLYESHQDPWSNIRSYFDIFPTSGKSSFFRTSN